MKKLLFITLTLLVVPFLSFSQIKYTISIGDEEITSFENVAVYYTIDSMELEGEIYAVIVETQISMDTNESEGISYYIVLDIDDVVEGGFIQFDLYDLELETECSMFSHPEEPDVVYFIYEDGLVYTISGNISFIVD